VTLLVETNDMGKSFIEKNRETITSATLLKNIEFRSLTVNENKIGDMVLKLDIE